jgi:hypothetical protein
MAIDPWADPWSTNPWALLSKVKQAPQTLVAKLSRKSSINQAGTSTVISPLNRQTVTPSLNCTGAPSDPLACMENPDGSLNVDYVLQTLNNSMSGATDF